jgi:hypothetical protein
MTAPQDKPHASRASAKPHFTLEDIKEAVDADEERLFKDWSTGRPEGWKCDQQTKDAVCLYKWLSERLSEMVVLGIISDDDRKIKEQKFNRWARSRTDLHQLTSEIINEAINGEIERDRIPHHRWG